MSDMIHTFSTLGQLHLYNKCTLNSCIKLGVHIYYTCTILLLYSKISKTKKILGRNFTF